MRPVERSTFPVAKAAQVSIDDGKSKDKTKPADVRAIADVPVGAEPIAPDGTFKSADELRAIYLEEKGVDPNQPTIAYAVSANAPATRGSSCATCSAWRTCATTTAAGRSTAT